jgi:ribonuclease VapC
VIVDSSAVVAVLLREPGHEQLIQVFGGAEVLGIGAPTLAETGLVMTAKLGPSGKALVARFVQEAGLSVVPFGEDHWPVAVDAYARFGRGRHPASLNFGDCLTYAVARLAEQPLICVGDDFAKTGLPIAA